MSNMSYCRFENTSHDLADCVEHVGDKLRGEYEIDARRALIQSAISLLEKVGLAITVAGDENNTPEAQIDYYCERFQEEENDEESDPCDDCIDAEVGTSKFGMSPCFSCHKGDRS